MKFSMERELLLEVGMILFAAGLLGGLGVLLFGRAKGGVDRSRQRSKGAPPSGSISGERHHNVATVAAR